MDPFGPCGEDALDAELEACYENSSVPSISSDTIFPLSSDYFQIPDETVFGNGFAQNGSTSGLTFNFPGWGIDITRDNLGKSPNVTKHFNALENRKKFKVETPDKNALLSFEGSMNVKGTPIFCMPLETLFLILRRLSFIDICKLRITCKRMYHFLKNDEIWSHVFEQNNKGAISTLSNSLKEIPLYICFKSCTLTNRMNESFFSLRIGYEVLRSTFDLWWDSGGLSEGPYSSDTVYRIMHKLTRADWTLFYEALAIAFMDRSDRILCYLQSNLKNGCDFYEDISASIWGEGWEGLEDNRQLNLDFWGQKQKCIVKNNYNSICTSDNIENYESSKVNDAIRSVSSPTHCSTSTVSDFKSHQSIQGTIKQVMNGGKEEDGSKGRYLWKEVINQWLKYKRWLKLIVCHCRHLNQEVLVERSKALVTVTTPSVYNKGVISFRNNILLAYGVRKQLQVALGSLVESVTSDDAKDEDFDLLLSVQKLYQELDISDDTSLNPLSFTQSKFQRCFKSLVYLCN